MLFTDPRKLFCLFAIAFSPLSYAGRTFTVSVPINSHTSYYTGTTLNNVGWIAGINLSVTNLSAGPQTVTVTVAGAGAHSYVVPQGNYAFYDTAPIPPITCSGVGPSPNYFASCATSSSFQSMAAGKVLSYGLDLMSDIQTPTADNGFLISFAVNEDRGAVSATGIFMVQGPAGYMYSGAISINGGRPF